MNWQGERAVADASVRWPSVMLASVSAGPLFFLGIGIGTLIADPAAPVSIYLDWQIGFAMPIRAMAAAYFGAFIAFLPNLIGTALMTSIGNRHEAARLPLIWMLAGATAGAVPMAASGAGTSGMQPVYLIALTFTGACCALICRRRIEWPDIDLPPR